MLTKGGLNRCVQKVWSASGLLSYALPAMILDPSLQNDFLDFYI